MKEDVVMIITASGKVRKVQAVSPFAENSIKVNGEVKNILNPAKGIEYATGVVIVCEDGRGCVFSDDFVVGNLPQEKVSEIIHAIAEHDYYDFSGLKYQKADTLDHVVLDGGKSLPYNSDSTFFNDMVALDNIKGMNFALDNVYSNKRRRLSDEVSECLENGVSDCFEDGGTLLPIN
jgi:hypothetical protein